MRIQKAIHKSPHFTSNVAGKGPHLPLQIFVMRSQIRISMEKHLKATGNDLVAWQVETINGKPPSPVSN